MPLATIPKQDPVLLNARGWGANTGGGGGGICLCRVLGVGGDHPAWRGSVRTGTFPLGFWFKASRVAVATPDPAVRVCAWTPRVMKLWSSLAPFCCFPPPSFPFSWNLNFLWFGQRALGTRGTWWEAGECLAAAKILLPAHPGWFRSSTEGRRNRRSRGKSPVLLLLGKPETIGKPGWGP